MKIAICIASRGLIHSKTLESVCNNLRKGYRWRMFFTHDLPIPDAQNDLVARAMKWGATYLFFVEEDMFIPKHTLNRMLEEKKPIMAVDYPVGDKRYSCIARKKGEILWCGLGCTLIHRNVFDKIGKPWFETDKTVRITSEDPFEYVIDEGIPYKYGGHDILFGVRAREKGVEISQLDGITAGHIKPVSSGKDGSNDGIHKFEVWREILNFQHYN